MTGGNKILARSLIAQTLESIKRLQLEKYHKSKTEEDKSKIQLDPKAIFHNAVENCKPILMLTPIKRGGVKYQVPVPISEKKAQFMSMKWLIQAGQEKDKTVRFHLQLARELIDAANNTGRVVKKNMTYISNVKLTEHMHIIDGVKFHKVIHKYILYGE
nr:unnamed protein product [Callosobruchus chinensis]